ncbi:MmcQ/YjbR family DNA-binding protein [uncultured Fluviicola sp.]|uniref:MmcQ/YjbR family DNA-binding protein n=1 Tax=uncultured Fluviicola sp. TaxID=463303 RepID=UPI0025EFDDD0|nr:MmcQ/YjbR family DNA-binding protein [uncultured Fluviicola sp.]
MDIETVRTICKELPHVTEDVKWEHDLVFSIGLKMFCVTGLDETPVSVSFKVTNEEFEELSNSSGFRPAPYVARYKWVLLEDISMLKKSELQAYIRQSYELVKAKLPAKIRKELDNQ